MSDFPAGSFGSFLLLPPPRRADLAQKNGKQRNFIACNVVVKQRDRERGIAEKHAIKARLAEERTCEAKYDTNERNLFRHKKPKRIK